MLFIQYSIAFLLFHLRIGWSLPVSEPSRKLAFSLADPDDSVVKTAKPTGIAGVLKEITDSVYFRDFMSLMKIVSDTQHTPQAKAAPTHTQADPIPLERKNFEASLSMDDSVQTVPSAHSISKEEWAHTLFGERGVLTGIFQMMDQQRKNPPPLSDPSPTASIDGKPLDMDFKKIFDSLLMGSSNSKFGDPGPELPEFLGICNRLSCGDIYKAIDKFRRSEFFSNFQTALTLIQDPNGWETIGKLLSNPELISQFTAGSGMEELFGSALGQAKNETGKHKDKNQRLLPEDGDFGTDFSEMEKGAKKPEMPEIDFNVDSKSQVTDYYEEVNNGGDSDEDQVEVDERPPEVTMSTTTTASTTTSSTTTTTTTTTERTKEEAELPEISFSIDGPEEEEGETFENFVDVAPPPSTPIRSSMSTGDVIKTDQLPFHKAVGSFKRLPLTMVFLSTTPSTTSTTTTTTTTRPTTTTTRRTTTTTPRKTTTTKNLRKDSDYYAMYYDDQPG